MVEEFIENKGFVIAMKMRCERERECVCEQRVKRERGNFCACIC